MSEWVPVYTFQNGTSYEPGCAGSKSNSVRVSVGATPLWSGAPATSGVAGDVSG